MEEEAGQEEGEELETEWHGAVGVEELEGETREVLRLVEEPVEEEEEVEDLAVLAVVMTRVMIMKSAILQYHQQNTIATRHQPGHYHGEV